MVVALCPRDLAGHRGAGALKCVHPDQRGEQRGAHHLAFAGPIALQQRRDGAVCAVHAREQVSNRHSYALWIIRARAGDGHQTRLALQDLVVPAAGGFGTIMAKTGDGQNHQPRVQLLHRRRRKSQPVQHAGAEILDDDVGPFQQLPKHLLTVLALQVKSDGLLIAVTGKEVGGLRVILRPNKRRPPAACIVPRARVLHLNHTRTEIAQHHAGVRPGKGAAQVHHQVTREWSLRGSPGCDVGLSAHVDCASFRGLFVSYSWI